MTKRDYYEVLRVEKGAGKEEIKKAYKKLAKEYHPDISKEEDSEEKFKEISEAYAVLSDDQKRAQYDQFGHAGFDQRFSQEDIFRNFNFDIFREFGFGGGGFDSIFDIFFGRQRQHRRGKDLRYDLELEFEEAVFGTEKEIKVERDELCPSCQGTGAEGDNYEQCSTCGGRGQVQKTTRSIFGMMSQIVSCPDCGGSGKTITKRCKDCNGAGTLYRESTLKVDIPAGVDNGTQIRLAGQGEAIDTGHTGDLYVVIHVMPHGRFKREGSDIYLEAPVNFATLVNGGKITVPTIRGEAELKIPSGTESHTLFRLKNEGVEKLRRRGRGDQYVRVTVEIPKSLSRKQKKLLKEWEKSD